MHLQMLTPKHQPFCSGLKCINCVLYSSTVPLSHPFFLQIFEWIPIAHTRMQDMLSLQNLTYGVS